MTIISCMKVYEWNYVILYVNRSITNVVDTEPGTNVDFNLGFFNLININFTHIGTQTCTNT